MNKKEASAGKGPGKISRRSFLQWSALAAAGPTLSKLATGSPAYAVERSKAASDFKLEEATIAQMQEAMESGDLSARDLVGMYLERIGAIDRGDINLRSIIETNPDALDIADMLDEERKKKGPRGPLHGIPILLKDNIDTIDDMETTAGSLALLTSRPPRDATMAERLREAGAIILGKANLSEWANFRSFRSSSGWSGRGRQGRNPYVLDRNPCGSSSGSCQAVSANLVAASLGTETNGSIVCPSSICGVVGIKPTVGLTSRAGVIPIAHTQDTVGPHGRTVADAATVLGALTGVDERDEATRDSEGNFFTDYTKFLDPDGLRGARIGVARRFHSGFSEHTDRIFNAAVNVMRDLGAVITEDVVIPGEEDVLRAGIQTIVLEYEFKADIRAYLDERGDPNMHELADLIRFNEQNAGEEMPYFRQERFEASQRRGPLTDRVYLEAIERYNAFRKGFTGFMERNNFDALIAPTGSPTWTTDLINGDRFLGASSTPAAIAGFPLVTLPAGFAFEHLPVGITFMGVAWSEPTLIKLAFAFEQATRVRRAPQLLPTLRLP